MESMMLLLPEPFGPDMTLNPSKRGIFVFLAKDLKLSISSSVICKDTGSLLLRRIRFFFLSGVDEIALLCLERDSLLVAPVSC